MLAAIMPGSVSATMGASCVSAALVCNGTATGAKANQRHIDDGVVHAGETQYAHPITGPHGLVRPRAGDRAGALPHLPVGDGVESRQQLSCGAAGVGVIDELHRALPKRGPVRVAVHDSLHELRQPQTGPLHRGPDRLVGAGSGELRVAGVQLLDAASQPVLCDVSGHFGTS
jgi:hypothetical protein